MTIFSKIKTAALAAGIALAVGLPAAHADEQKFHCGEGQ
jgi:branched-chain amino acid transport system substrate-binding protein